MFGFSLGKLIVLALIGFGLWHLFKLGSGKADRKSRGQAGFYDKTHGEAMRRAQRERDAHEGVEDAVKCPKCGVYVAQSSKHTCRSKES